MGLVCVHTCVHAHTSVVFGVCFVVRSEGGSDFRTFLFLCCLARPLSRTELGCRGLCTRLVRDDLCLSGSVANDVPGRTPF